MVKSFLYYKYVVFTITSMMFCIFLLFSFLMHNDRTQSIIENDIVTEQRKSN